MMQNSYYLNPKIGIEHSSFDTRQIPILMLLHNKVQITMLMLCYRNLTVVSSTF